MIATPQPFRPEPRLPATAMKTYAISSPKTTHTRRATCAEVECEAYKYGWWTKVDEGTPLGKEQASYIRARSERAFVEQREGPLTVFFFSPGQRCFASDAHTVSLEREPFYIVREGDHRGNPRGAPARTHTRGEFWVEDFAEHQQRLADRLAQG